MALYNAIGQNYDTSRRADPYIVSRLTYHLDIQPDGNYLDVACGTGNYTSSLANFGGVWQAMDQSSQMIDTAVLKNTNINWQIADADKLPYKNSFFDGIMCTLAIHHFPELAKPFKEIHRVLQNGKFVLFTSTPEQMKNYWLWHYFPDAMQKSAAQMPRFEMVADNLSAAGFSTIKTEAYSVQKDLKDFFLYSGKFSPEIYLDEKLRAGISTFAKLADPKEIEAGCLQLEKDIKSKRIFEIIEQHANMDDYLFVIASK